MKLYRKEEDTVHLLAFPDEVVERGDYLLVEEPKSERGLLVQVFDVQFANPPGIMEDLIRDAMVEGYVFGDDLDPLNLGSQMVVLRDLRLVLAKIRCSIVDGKISHHVSWIPSRTGSTVRRLDVVQVLEKSGFAAARPITLGTTPSGSLVKVDARCLDGRLTIILGRKGTGKSNLSKLLLLGLLDYGAPCVVFDVNGEYTGLRFTREGAESPYSGKLAVLEPGGNFKVSLKQVGLSLMLNILIHALDLPATSSREFQRIWRSLEARGILTMRGLVECVKVWDCHESVREALMSRLSSLEACGFFSDNLSGAVSIDGLLRGSREGIGVIVNLRELPPQARRIVVEFTLGRLVELLRSLKLKAVFLFAEEAHLYLRETYWEDIVTRMRHFGLFTTFITNQPDSIGEEIYRQADSIFLFNFKNEGDLEAISKVSRIDAETMRLVAKTLQPHYCLVIGEASYELPLIVRVRSLDVQAMGETRRFFD